MQVLRNNRPLSKTSGTLVRSNVQSENAVMNIIMYHAVCKPSCSCVPDLSASELSLLNLPILSTVHLQIA